jgi:hypothetical protein
MAGAPDAKDARRMFPPQTNPTRTLSFNRGYGYAISGASGTIAAGLAQDALVLALLCDPVQGNAAANRKLGLYFDRLAVAFTTIAAFTTPIAAGRRLGVYRATGGQAATGGVAMAVAKKDAANAPASVCTSALIAAAGALGTAGITREATPIGTMDLTHVGAAGARQEFLFELAAPANAPIAINPGELLVVSNPATFDAGGTWQLTLKEAHWNEAMREERTF